MPNVSDSKIGKSDGPPPSGHVSLIPQDAREATKKSFMDLGRLIGRYAKRHLPAGEHKDIGPPEPPRLTGSHEKALRYLQFIPTVLFLAFVASFFTDTPDSVLSVWGIEFSLQGGLIRIISVSGLIGFLTNWLAITMLFRPRQPRPVFGQGLVPAQRNRVVFRLANAVSTELINAEIIKKKIQDSELIPKYREISLQMLRNVVSDDDFRIELRQFLEQYIHEVFDSPKVQQQMKAVIVERLEAIAGKKTLGDVALKTYRFFLEEDFQKRVEIAIREIPNNLEPILEKIDPLLLEFPDRIEARADDIEQWVTESVLSFVNNIDVYSMVFENLNKYDEARLEHLIKSSTNEQLNYIKYLGGILGLFGGLVIWNPALALTFFGAVGVVLVGLDVLLYRVTER